jgi:hypothetical protein
MPVIAPRGHSEPGGRRWALFGAIALLLTAALAGGAFLAVRHWWPAAQFEPSAPALTSVTVAPFGEHVVSVRAREADGTPVAVRLRGGRVEPTTTLAGDTRLFVRVTIRRSGWIGWLVGGSEVVHTVVRTPEAEVAARFVYPRPGRPVQVTFSRPVAVVSVRTADAKVERLTLRHPRRTVSIGISAAGADTAGTAFVAGAARPWEQLPEAVRINWFPAGPLPNVLVRPSPHTMLEPTAPIVLTFSRPVADVLGTHRPRLVPRTRGVWTEPNSHTLVFQPSGLGFPLGRRLHLRLPSAIQVIAGDDPDTLRTLTWQVPRGTLLRLRELLAELGYLPLDWHPAGAPVRLTPGAEARAAVHTPAGTFAWRYPGTPAALKEIWSSGDLRPVLVRGAIMAFESAHGMAVDGWPSMAVFRALIRAQLNGRRAEDGYSYVYVSEALPQTLTLWHDGQVVLSTPVNTGIASRPTALGTYPVYAHLTSTTMSGTNPDGSHYSDAGVPWVNYFNGGDAVHGFVRGSYGWPQSLGCVEVPVSTAEQIFPYVQIGTLVTVTA